MRLRSFSLHSVMMDASSSSLSRRRLHAPHPPLFYWRMRWWIGLTSITMCMLRSVISLSFKKAIALLYLWTALPAQPNGLVWRARVRGAPLALNDTHEPQPPLLCWRIQSWERIGWAYVQHLKARHHGLITGDCPISHHHYMSALQRSSSLLWAAGLKWHDAIATWQSPTVTQSTLDAWNDSSLPGTGCG